MTGLLATLAKWAAVAAIAAFALHYVEGRGYERREQELSVEHARVEAEHARILAENTADAAQREQELLARLQQSTQVAQQRKHALALHLARQEQQHLETRHASSDESRTLPEPGTATADHLDRPLLGSAVLDERTVRLLDDARANAPAQAGGAAGGADEESRATAVTGADFALNDLEVVRMYHELAARHDGLVDWVNHQCVDPTRQPHRP